MRFNAAIVALSKSVERRGLRPTAVISIATPMQERNDCKRKLLDCGSAVAYLFAESFDEKVIDGFCSCSLSPTLGCGRYGDFVAMRVIRDVAEVLPCHLLD